MHHTNALDLPSETLDYHSNYLVIVIGSGLLFIT